MSLVSSLLPAIDPVSTAHAEPAEVELIGLTRRYGTYPAVNAVDLRIRSGEFFCLVGGSGSGKTTLLRMVAGFTEPSSGDIRIRGKSVVRLPPYRRPVNMMFQSYALFPHMSVESNVAFGLRRDGVAGQELRRRVGEVLELVQMAGFARRRPEQLSGGQRQRVALARALVKRPQVLLLDEPLSALDKKLREQTQLELQTIQAQVGITFLMVTHDQQEAMTVSDRIAVMRDGRIVQVDTPSGLYERPCNRFVADFIGEATLFAGWVAGCEGRAVQLDCPAEGAKLVGIAHRPLAMGEAAFVAVRPQNLVLSAAGVESATANTLAGRITGASFRGETCHYQVELEGGTVAEVSESNRDGWASRRFQRGDIVSVGWDVVGGVVVPA